MTEDPLIITRTSDSSSFSVAKVPTDQLLEKQAGLLFKQAVKAMGSALVVALLSVVVFWHVIPHSYLIIWLLAVTGLTAARMLLSVSVKITDEPFTGLMKKRNLYDLGISLSGALWGIAAFQFSSDWPVEQQIFLFFALAGICAGAISSYSVLYRSYLLFLLPTMAPLSVSLLFSGGTTHISMGLLLVLFAGVMSVFALIQNKSIRGSLSLSIENQRLIDDLSKTNRRLRQEVSQKQTAMEQLIEEKERIQVTLQSIGDGVITTDSQNTIRFMNPVAEQLTGWSLDEARGKPVLEVFRLADDIGKKQFKEDRRAHPGGSFWNTLGDHQLLCRRDGEVFYGKSVASTITGEEGENYGSVVVFHDVSEQRKLTEHLSYQAKHDPLTGLINRREFEWSLDTALVTAKEQNLVHSLCYIDLDQFKIVNDTCGHDAGDELLKQLAYGITQQLRETDMLSRLGGDEFGLLLDACAATDACKIAEKIRKHIKDNRFVWDNKVFEVGASIGVVEVNSESETVGKLLSAADIACYAAKENGRNQVHLYQGEESEPGKRHSEIRLVTHITRALEDDTLVLYFQEIRDLRNPDDAVPYGEVLIRMQYENGELVSPGLFIPAAERYNLMPTIDLWVIRNTLAWCQGMLDKGSSIGRLSINLSGHSLGSKQFGADVIKLFAEHDVSPEKICFEITETAAISNFSSAVQLIQRLRERGCQFALDDFGSGLSSFSYLKKLSVDYLKIDGSFIKDIVHDEIDREMVKSMHQLARMMGMKTIAEFVEDESILKEIKSIGIDFAQGYGIAKPVPLNIITAANSVSSIDKEAGALV